MTQIDPEFLSFLQTWIIVPASGIAVWAWKENKEEHQMLKAAQDKLRDNTSTGHSVLNDRIMEYVDSTMVEVRDENRRRSDKLAEHIEKLFANAESDRRAFNQTMAEHREDSYKRHIELLHAINSKADK